MRVSNITAWVVVKSYSSLEQLEVNRNIFKWLKYFVSVQEEQDSSRLLNQALRQEKLQLGAKHTLVQRIKITV